MCEAWGGFWEARKSLASAATVGDGKSMQLSSGRPNLSRQSAANCSDQQRWMKTAELCIGHRLATDFLDASVDEEPRVPSFHLVHYPLVSFLVADVIVPSGQGNGDRVSGERRDGGAERDRGRSHGCDHAGRVLNSRIRERVARRSFSGFLVFVRTVEKRGKVE